jgi:hypothetical protein
MHVVSHCIPSLHLTLRCITLHPIASPHIALHHIAPHCFSSHCVASHCFTSHCFTSHCFTSHCFTSHCFTSHRCASFTGDTMKVNLTPNSLLDLIKEATEQFSDDMIPLSKNQKDAILRFSAYMTEDPKRNHLKKASQGILRDMWKHMPEVFILCALVTFPSNLACVDPTSCHRMLLIWWKGAEHPKGLEWIIEKYPDILPGNDEPATITSGDVQKRGLEITNDGRRIYCAHPKTYTNGCLKLTTTSDNVNDVR